MLDKLGYESDSFHNKSDSSKNFWCMKNWRNRLGLHSVRDESIHSWIDSMINRFTVASIQWWNDSQINRFKRNIVSVFGKFIMNRFSNESIQDWIDSLLNRCNPKLIHIELIHDEFSKNWNYIPFESINVWINSSLNRCNCESIHPW